MFLQLPLLLITAEEPEVETEDGKPTADDAKKALEKLDELARNLERNRQTRLGLKINESYGSKLYVAPNAEASDSNRLRISIKQSQNNDNDNTRNQLLTGDMKFKEHFENILAPPPPEKSIGSIYLPAPELSTTSSFSWEQDQNKAVEKLREITSAVDAVTQSGGVTQVLGSLVATMAKDNDDLITQTLFANNRIAFNEPVQQYFRGLDVRTFDFDWKFIPKDLQEWKTIKGIIETLNKHAHPEIVNNYNSKFYNYPAEFILEFQHKGRLNKNLPKIGRCVCASVEVGYSSNRMVTHDNGEPVEIDLSLSFVEMEKLDSSLFGGQDHSY